MSQTSAIAAALVIAFIVFITVRGQLSCYMEIMGISTGGQCSNLSVSGSNAGLSLTSGGGGIAIVPPAIGLGPVVIAPPTIRI